MPKKNRKSWQTLGFRTYKDYQRYKKERELKRIFKECLLEAATAEKDRLQLKQTRLNATQTSPAFAASVPPAYSLTLWGVGAKN